MAQDLRQVFSARDLQRLEGVHPDLIDALGIVFAQMMQNGHAMFVVMGVRTTVEQANLYAQGRTRPGRIVTNKDGYKHPSDHQPHTDLLGHAVDCAFLGPDPFGEVSEQPWEAYGELIEAQGLTWGGRWSHPHDSPHAQLA